MMVVMIIIIIIISSNSSTSSITFKRCEKSQRANIPLGALVSCCLHYY